MKTVIIASYKQDEHTRHVLRKAENLGVKAIVFDVGSYPQGAGATLELGPNVGSGNITLRLGRRKIQAHDVSGVWWRRPQGFQKPVRLTSMDQYIKTESESVVRSMREFLPEANWISDPEATRLANRKPVQLREAIRVGFRIPDTCITNSPVELRAFLKKLRGRGLAMKPVGTSFMRLAPRSKYDSKNNKVVFTKQVDPAMILEHIDMVGNCPVIFQEAIVKDSDIRVTVIDDTVYAVDIRLEGCGEVDNLDWRNYAGRKIYSPHTLPDEIAKMCVCVCARLGLRFGCIDLGFSEKDGYTFFEINPQGQWLPSEVKFGYNISGSIIDSLTR